MVDCDKKWMRIEKSTNVDNVEILNMDISMSICLLFEDDGAWFVPRLVLQYDEQAGQRSVLHSEFLLEG